MEVSELLAGPPYGQPLILWSGATPVARLRFEDADFPWVRYRFSPLPSWEALGDRRAIFNTQAGRRESPSGGLTIAEQRQQAIVELDLWLSNEQGQPRVGDFLFGLHEGYFHVRSFKRG